MNRHPIQWISPSPLWSRFVPEGTAVAAADQFRPAILRFASDDFMDQLLAILAKDPKALGDLIARPETWRNPGGVGPDLVDRVALPRAAKALERLKAAREPRRELLKTVAKAKHKEQKREREITLKLYQPAHQRFYLVAADLVCQAAGFPRHALATGGRERFGFVIRRVMPPGGKASTKTAAEHAFVKDAKGAQWKEVGTQALVPGEELLPLFPMSFQDDLGHPRRLLAGMIPVGRREEYLTSGLALKEAEEKEQAGAANTSRISAHKEQFRMEVAEPWKNLIRIADTAHKNITDKSAKPPAGLSLREARRAQAGETNLQLQMQSWLVLLDFADYLEAHLPKVWNAVRTGDESRLPVGSHARKLYRWLDSVSMSADLKRNLAPLPEKAKSLRQALRDIVDARNDLEGAETLYSGKEDDPQRWPAFQYLLAGVGEDDDEDDDSDARHFSAEGPFSAFSVHTVAAEEADRELESLGIGTRTSRIDKMTALVILALDLDEAEAAPPLPFASSLQRVLDLVGDDPGWFVIRCIHERCDCGPLRPTLVSAPTQLFQLANFFDPDAPARPIRISLPLDTTPAGLRKFNKNTALMVSDVLCGQIARAKGLGLVDLVRAVLPWPLHKDLEIGEMGPCKKGSPEVNIGMICSLSIPIVTLCALILLMIIVSILDYIFRWMPYLIMCFPVPGLKAKPPSPTPPQAP